MSDEQPTDQRTGVPEPAEPSPEGAAPGAETSVETAAADEPSSPLTPVEPTPDPPTEPAPHAPVTASPRPPFPAPPRPVQGPDGLAPAPVTAAPVSAPAPVVAAGNAPDRWGRVDPDGTIYLRAAEGERVVGSWQAGAPAEGLAHFARRFDDLRTEVELLAARLATGGSDPKQALASARVLRDGLAQASVVGDVAGLHGWLSALITLADEAVGAARSARDAQRAAAIAHKEVLAAEAEALATEATQWKQAGDRFKAILDEWRAVRGVDRKTDESLWKRFSKAREAFNRRRGSHFADLDRQRATAKARKEELAVEAEKLLDSDDWATTAARLRELMTEWKAAGRAQKDVDDALWARFRAAQDTFFARRTATFVERDAEFTANAETKQALLVEAEKIDLSEPAAARAALRGIQARWEEVGKVPREDVRPLELRMRAVEERVREATERQWRRSDPEAEARVAQFRDRVAQFEAQARKARAAGDTGRAEQAESQAEQWREWLATAERAVQHR